MGRWECPPPPRSPSHKYQRSQLTPLPVLRPFLAWFGLVLGWYLHKPTSQPQGERPPLHLLPDQRCPPRLRALVEAMWEHDPKRRPAVREWGWWWWWGGGRPREGGSTWELNVSGAAQGGREHVKMKCFGGGPGREGARGNETFVGAASITFGATHGVDARFARRQIAISLKSTAPSN